MNALPQFVAAGEALTDLLSTGPDSWSSKVGGSTWNVARVVARLGLPSAFAGGVSSDIFGIALFAASGAANLDLRFLQRFDRPPLLAVVYELSPPQYFFIGEDSADLHFQPALLPHGWQSHVRWVHFGGVSLAREPLSGKLATLAEELKKANVRISYDPNFRALMDERYDSVFRRMVALADVIKVSDEDLCGLFRSNDPGASLAILRGMNPDAMVLYTKGERGAQLLVGAETWQAVAPSIEVVDTVGAGDASIGALLYSMMARVSTDPATHLAFAVAAGAAACLSPGATPPTLDQVERLLVK